MKLLNFSSTKESIRESHFFFLKNSQSLHPFAAIKIPGFRWRNSTPKKMKNKNTHFGLLNAKIGQGKSSPGTKRRWYIWVEIRSFSRAKGESRLSWDFAVFIEKRRDLTTLGFAVTITGKRVGLLVEKPLKSDEWVRSREGGIQSTRVHMSRSSKGQGGIYSLACTRGVDSLTVMWSK